MKASGSALLLALLLGLVSGIRPGHARDESEVPLPVSKGQVVRDTEVVYTVEGRTRIPAGVEIACLKGITIRAKGRQAVLEVEGSLTIHGISGMDVTIDGVVIEPAAVVQQLHLDHCTLRHGAGVVTPEGQTTSGMITVENCTFEGEPGLQVAIRAGKLKIMSAYFNRPTRIRAVDPKGKKNRVYGSLRTTTFSGLVAENVADLTLRACVLLKSPAEFRDNVKLVFDGNRVEAGEVLFHQSAPGKFKKTQITKCDFYGSTLTFYAPADKKSDRVVLDKCWFEGETDPKVVAKSIHDRSDDAQCNVKVTVKKPAKRPHRFAGE